MYGTLSLRMHSAHDHSSPMNLSYAVLPEVRSYITCIQNVLCHEMSVTINRMHDEIAHAAIASDKVHHDCQITVLIIVGGSPNIRLTLLIILHCMSDLSIDP